MRDRYGLDVMRRFFGAIVEQCVAAGLVWGRELSIDSTDVAANASMDSLQPRFAVEAHLLFDDDRDGDGMDTATEAVPTCLPVVLTDEASADPAGCAATRHDWIGEAGRPDRTRTSGAYRRTADVRASATDPDASPLRPHGTGVRLGYHAHDVVDGGRARIIPTALVTPADVRDNRPAIDPLWRTRVRRKVRPRRVTGDAKVRQIEHVAAIEQEQIRADVPLSAVGHRTGQLRDTAFVDDPATEPLPLPRRRDAPRPLRMLPHGSADLSSARRRLLGRCAPRAVHDVASRTADRSEP